MSGLRFSTVLGVEALACTPYVIGPHIPHSEFYTSLTVYRYVS